MRKQIVILGGGTGGTLAANRLQRRLGEAAEITVVDADDCHVYQPGLLFVPFGMVDPDRLVRQRQAQLHSGIAFRLGEVEAVDAQAQRVHLAGGPSLDYDVLVVAAGAMLQPEETEGLEAALGLNAFSFYTLDAALRLRAALRDFDGGRLVVNLVDMPVKCPVAPLEFCFLADWSLRRRGVRGRTEITLATPLDAAFTKPIAAKHLGGMLSDRGIALETEFATGRVDGEQGVLESWDEREIPFDLLVSIPLHGGPAFVPRSPGLGDDLGFVLVDPHTLQAQIAPNVFAIGDAANVPTSKAGSVAHFEGQTLIENIERQLAGRPLEPSYNGHANCFIETGFHKALLIDFDYDNEPQPGRYPDRHLGPLTLLRESRANHIAKLMFEPVYWGALLKGREIPGVRT